MGVRGLMLIASAALVLAGCDPGPAAPPTDIPPTEVIATAAAPSPPATAEAVPLTPYADPAYSIMVPQGWVAVPGLTPEERLFTPEGDPTSGLLVRVQGRGYDFTVLDSLINSELQLLRQEGLAPVETAIRQPVLLPGGQGVGRSAWLDVMADGQPARMRVTALVANFATAYLLRFWGPEAIFDRPEWAAASDHIQERFTPVFVAAAPTTAPPTVTPRVENTATPAAPPLTVTAPAASLTPLPTIALSAIPLSAAPYQGDGFRVYYPEGWSLSENLDRGISFLPADPDALLGLTIAPLGTGYDPVSSPHTLLEDYLIGVQQNVPGAILGDQRLDESPGGVADGVSATYVVPFEGGHLVYRVTMLVARAGDGAAFRLIQWAPEGAYEVEYRSLFRAVVDQFRPLAGGS